MKAEAATSSTLITTHVRAEEALAIVADAIVSHQATCDSELHVWDHDALKHSLNQELRDLCARQGANYLYLDEPYHQTRWWNRFPSLVTTDLIVLSSADVVFHPGWLEAIRCGIKEHPGLLSYHPVTFSLRHRGLFYIDHCDLVTKRAGQVVVTANPLCHVICSLRTDTHRWDEAFPYWEADMDYHLTLERGPRKAGAVFGSRVDHLDGSQIRDSGAPVPFDNATMRFKKKWHLK